MGPVMDTFFLGSALAKLNAHCWCLHSVPSRQSRDLAGNHNHDYPDMHSTPPPPPPSSRGRMHAYSDRPQVIHVDA